MATESNATMREAMRKFLGLQLSEPAKPRVLRSTTVRDEIGRKAEIGTSLIQVDEANRALRGETDVPPRPTIAALRRAYDYADRFELRQLGADAWYTDARQTFEDEGDLELLGTYYGRIVQPQVERVIRSRYGIGARGILRQAQSHEDIAQSTARRVFAGLRRDVIKLGNYQEFSALSHRVARNRAVDILRSSPSDPVLRLNETLVRTFGPRVDGDTHLDVLEVRKKLEHLTPDQVDVIMLKVYGQLNNQEVADALGKTEGSVKSLYHRARKSLGKMLGYHVR